MTEENKTKIRIRFAGGEEFEAEGSPNFVEQQRNYFLSLIGKPAPSQTASMQAPASPSAAPLQPYTAPQIAVPQIAATPQRNPADNMGISPTRVWERVIREDGTRVYLRQKFKISIQESILLLLAGARVLLKKPSYSALELSKSVQESGLVLPNRMDRLLAGELENGILVSEGAKRSRTYKLSDRGFAKAFSLAEKLSK